MTVSDFLFESVYQIVTWVFIALSVGGIFYFASQGNRRLVMWSIIALFCSTAIMIGIIADRQFFHSAKKDNAQRPIAPTPEPMRGFLTPADDPFPKTPCSREDIPEGSIAFYMGSMAVVLGRPAGFLIRVKGEELLSYEKTNDGIYISALIRTADNKEVVRITRNAIRVTPQSGYYAQQPDAHTLIILDPSDRKALYVRYMNRSAMKMQGIFQGGALEYPIILEEDKTVYMNNSSMSGLCWVSESGNGFFNVP